MVAVKQHAYFSVHENGEAAKPFPRRAAPAARNLSNGRRLSEPQPVAAVPCPGGSFVAVKAKRRVQTTTRRVVAAAAVAVAGGQK